MRQLKHHEKKLLKKVDFLKWRNEDNLRELQVTIIVCAAPCPWPEGQLRTHNTSLCVRCETIGHA